MSVQLSFEPIGYVQLIFLRPQKIVEIESFWTISSITFDSTTVISVGCTN